MASTGIQHYVPDIAVPRIGNTYLYTLEGEANCGFIAVDGLTLSGPDWKAQVVFRDVEDASWVIPREEWLELTAQGRLEQVPRVGAKYDYRPVAHRPAVARIEINDHTLEGSEWGVVCGYELAEDSDHEPNSQEVLALKHHFDHPVGRDEWSKMVDKGYLVQVQEIPKVRR